MPDEGIQTKVSVLGDKEYKAALSDITRQLTVLNTDMTASQSAFAGQADSMEAVRSKLQSLQAIYAAHQQKVELIAAQLEKAKQEYGENSKQADNLKIALNRATTAMNKVGSEISTTENALNNMQSASETAEGSMGDLTAQTEEQTNASGELADAADKAGDAVKGEGSEADDAEKKNSKLKEAFQSAGSAAGGALVAGCKAAAAAMAAMGAAAAAALKASFDMAKDAGTYADDVATLSAQTGVSTQRLQEWSYASNFIDTSVERVSDSMKDLSKHMAEGFADSSGAAYQNFVQLGVSIKDFDGNMRGTEDVFWDAIDALHNMEAGAERDALAMQLFGDSARELNPLIEAGSAAWREMGKEAQAMGTVFSDENIAKMGAFDDSMQRFNATGAALKNSIGLVMIPAFQPLIETATSAMGQVAVALQDGLEPDELPGILNGLLNMVSGALDDVAGLIEDALPIVSAAVTQVVGALAERLPGLLTKLLPAAMQLLNSVVSAITANIGPITALASTLVQSLASLLSENAGALAGSALTLMDGLLDGILDVLPELLSAGITIVVKLAAGLIKGIPKLVAKLPEIVQAIWSGLTSTDWGQVGSDIRKACWMGWRASAGLFLTCWAFRQTADWRAHGRAFPGASRMPSRAF